MRNCPNLSLRTFDFSVKIIKVLRNIKFSRESDVIKHQLVKSATSVGANYEEAQGSFSREDFKYKMYLCFKEIREVNYWLRLIQELNIFPKDDLEYLLSESIELVKIFSSITRKLSNR